MFVCVIAVAVCASLKWLSLSLSLSLTHTHTHTHTQTLSRVCWTQWEISGKSNTFLVPSWWVHGRIAYGRIPQRGAVALRPFNFMNTSNTHQSISRNSWYSKHTHTSTGPPSLHPLQISFLVHYKEMSSKNFVRHVCGSPSSVVAEHVCA